MIGKSKVRFINEIKDRCNFHCHDHLEIVYNIKGDGQIYLKDGTEFKLRPHTVTIYKPNVWHAQQMIKPGIDYCLLIDINAMDSAKKFPSVYHIPILKSQRIRKELISIVKTQCDTHAPYAKVLNLRVSALLMELYQIQTPQNITSLDERLLKAKSFIESSFMNMNSIEEAAKIADISPDYFRHRFKDFYGISPKEYWLNCQLDHAKLLLKNSPLPQKAIALQCGFKNIRYFNTRFSHYIGMPPGKYKNKK
ncbi:MAG: hypothetical protein COA79_07385 [Planctomycetota bacterium]|nr:MAG: hypothetical protein COA79_07385 [Planctomycetota bacterium]